ncbi:MAG: SPOR domain-containing protein [Marinilabilia sp.]
MKKTLLVAAAFLIIGAACKDEEKPTQTTQTSENLEQSAPSEPDTTTEKVEEETPEPPAEPEEPNKYFLIAGSFEKSENAESFQKQLNEQGFQSEVITRDWGKNNEFYKVSYMGFQDKNEAIERMKQERNKDGKEDVWVLVKR